MKKNVMMRVASVLLICVLLTSSVISGTFAKYVTTGTGSDIARVAKWGVSVTPNGDIFLQEYDTYDSADIAKVGNKSVNSENEWDVVAPGTSGAITEVDLAGTPEVAVRVTYSAVVTLEGWNVTGGEYCPLIFNIEGTTYGTVDTAADVKCADVAALKAKLEEVIAAYHVEYAANTQLDHVAYEADALSISWSWPFYVDAAHDIKDTELGNLAAAGNWAVVKIDVTTTVTQID